jgi:Ca2+-binding EF-hand superfamily protein
MCHIKTMPTDMSSMVAPAIIGVMRHVKMSYPKKEDAVAFMVDYVQYPSEKKAICMKQKIARFGVMPSQKGNITPQELAVVAGWMFDNFPPSNFRGRGMQQGMGMKQGCCGSQAGGGMQNRPTFAMFDINGDGKVTQEEFDTAQSMQMKRRMGSMNKTQGMGKNRSPFTMIDLNNDGSISKKEFSEFRAVKQGKQKSTGMPMRNISNAPTFESIDTDKNGKITQDEFNAFRR